MNNAPAPPAGDFAARGFRRHGIAFWSVNAALQIANFATGAPWWAFWPLIAWSLVFCVHYLVYKARRVDERWAEERTADVRSKSYDRAHMDNIGDRYDADAKSEPSQPR
jgi:hypothetical protein